ncbi:MAG: double-strand break repair protein AddB [Alphaproteobacteria bacterium]
MSARSGARVKRPRRRRSTVYTIPPGVAFLDALAAGVLAEAASDPLALSRYTLLLPTRRACRALGEAFLRQTGGRPLLLPRMMPIGDLDEDELTLAGAEEPGPSGGLDLEPAMPELRRRLALARLILKWKPTLSADQAAQLAAELGRLLDQVQIERLGFDRLAELVPEAYAAHWQITLEFLRILTDHWPRILAEEGCVDPAARRNLVLEAQAETWRRKPPADPVIAAGSTGTIPATADLLEVVAGLPQGRVVLPGLDRHTGEEDWERLEPTHPQFAIKGLLKRLGLSREEVEDWEAPGLKATAPARAALAAEAMRPAAEAEAWRPIKLPPAAIRGVRRLDCATPHEEAGVIALIMRRTLEYRDEGKSAALVTPDRGLARRVAAELKRWDIEIDDSAGQPLAATPPGAFLRLTAEMIAERAAPIPLLAALKHPLAAGGMRPAAFRAAVRRLELALLRGPRPGEGFRGLRAALKSRPPSVSKGSRASKDRAFKDLDRWLADLEKAARTFSRVMERDGADLAGLARAHVAFAEALTASEREAGGDRLWAGEAGEAAAGFVAELMAAADGFGPIPGRAYPALLGSLMEGRVVRPRYGRHPRLHIWGPLEARLQHADMLILGGLNEGTWPPEPAVDPWLSRPMRKDFGLPPPERRIGLSAHDFAQALCAREVVLTRASRVEGTPTVPSRWLLRLETLLRLAGLEGRIEGPREWLGWQRGLDLPERVIPAERPAPRPPVRARPRQLSVTQVETWMRDPYAIYARKILGLEPLDPIDADPGAAERGKFIHRALDEFVKAYPEDLPEGAVARLLETGREAFGPALARPGVWAFWWPRFERIATWFVETERRRRAGARPLATEVHGKHVLEGPAGAFVLTATADRIDALAPDGLAIIDYKTGGVPLVSDIAAGLAPQLPLEAAMAEAGAFAGVPKGAVRELGFWRLTGGDPAGEKRPVRHDPAALARQALDGVRRLIAAFDDPATPYLAHPRPDHAPDYGDYDHLARLKEWAAGGGAGDR